MRCLVRQLAVTSCGSLLADSLKQIQWFPVIPNQGCSNRRFLTTEELAAVQREEAKGL